MSARAGHALEVRQGVEREIHLSRGTTELVAADILDELAGQISPVDEFEECEPGVNAGRNHAGIDFIAILESYANRAAVLDNDPSNRGLLTDFDSCLDRGFGDGIRNSARPAPGKSPGAKGAIDLAHVVME